MAAVGRPPFQRWMHAVGLLHFLLWQEQVEHHGEQEHHGHAVFGKHGAHYLGEDVEHTGGLGEAEANAERETHDNHVALRESRTRHHAESGEEDAAEHHYGAAAEHGLRYGGEHIAHGGEYAADNHHHGTHANGEAVDYARHGGKADVLAERRDGRAAKESRHGAYETVAADGRAHFRLVRIALQGTVAQSRRVAYSLRSRHEVDGHNGEDGTDVELGLERQQTGQGEERLAGDAAEVDHAHAECEHVAYHQSDKHRQRAHESLGEHLAQEAGEQRHAAYNPVVEAAEVGRALASGKRVGTHGQKREADGRDHRGRHDVRHELYPILGEEAENALNESANDDGSDERAHAVGRAHADGEREEGERDAHDDRQARTDAPHGVELHERADAGYHHTVLYEHRTNVLVEPHGTGKNHYRSDVADEHRQHVLQAKRESLPQWHSTVELVEILC